MPTNFVKTPKDEHLWEKAKEIVRKEYGKTEDDGESFWKLVTGVYKQAGGRVLDEEEAKRLKKKDKLQKSVELPESDGDYIEQSLSMLRQIVEDWWKEKE